MDFSAFFQVCSSHLLCIASVPGAKETDFRVDEELNRLIVEESEIAEEEAELERRKEQPSTFYEGEHQEPLQSTSLL